METSLPLSTHSFETLAHSLHVGVGWLEGHMPQLGDQGPTAVEYMKDAANNLCLRLEPRKVTPGFEIPDSVRTRTIRHDFRNLIAAIVGFAELLLLEDNIQLEIQEKLLELKADSRDFCYLLDSVRDSAA
jgi:signal transduction histidine kinase